MITFGIALILAQTAEPALAHWIALGITILIQIVGIVWLLSKMNFGLNKLQEDIKKHESLPERVSKVEWELTQNKESFTEMKDSLHKANNKLNEITLCLQSLKDWVDSQKDGNK